MPGLMKPVALDADVLNQLNESYRLCATCLDKIDENAVQPTCCLHFTHQECFRVQFIHTLANKRWKWEPTDMRCGLCRRDWKLSFAEEEIVCTLLEAPFTDLRTQQELYFKLIQTPSSDCLQALQAFPFKCAAQVLRSIRDHIQNEIRLEVTRSAGHLILFDSGKSSIGQKWRKLCKTAECLKLIGARLGDDRNNIAALDLWLRFLFNRDTVSAVMNEILSAERCPTMLMNQFEPLDLTPIIKTQMLKFGALIRESGEEATTNCSIAESLLRFRGCNVRSRKGKDPESTPVLQPAPNGPCPSSHRSSRTVARSTLTVVGVMIFAACLKEFRWPFYLLRIHRPKAEKVRHELAKVNDQQTSSEEVLSCN